MPYVTIVMPAYNSEMYIAQAIESVINQTHTNFELLICDDGSTDGTTSIVSKYIVQDNRITGLSYWKILTLRGRQVLEIPV